MKWIFGVGIAAALAAGSIGASTVQIREGAYRVAIVGDSLATGAGIGRDQGYPLVMQQLAYNERWPVRITVHAGNGETTADGVRRMDDVLRTRPDVIVLAVGGNDGLQGRPTEEIRANLEEMIRRALSTGAQVVLAGMEAPPNAPMDYRIRFRRAFSRLGRTTPVWFMPFLLEGVALNPRLNQRDGIHPNEVGARRIAHQLWPYVTAAVRHAADQSADLGISANVNTDFGEREHRFRRT